MSSSSCSDAQIFNGSNLEEKIEDGSLRLMAPKPLREGGPDLQYFRFMTTPTAEDNSRGKNSQLQDLQRCEDG